MLILINGNIAAGKSEVSRHLAALRGWPIASMDDLRREHSDGTWAGEALAMARLIDMVARTRHVIVEITSGNRHMDGIIMAHTDQAFFVLLDTPAATCLERVRQRREEGYRWPPVPWPAGNVEDSVHYLEGIVRLLEHDLHIPTAGMSPREIADHIDKHLP
jgi:adenylate kinase family enzyme